MTTRLTGLVAAGLPAACVWSPAFGLNRGVYVTGASGTIRVVPQPVFRPCAWWVA